MQFKWEFSTLYSSAPLLDNGELLLPRGVQTHHLSGQARHFSRQEALVLRGAQQLLDAARVLRALRALLHVYSTELYTRTIEFNTIQYCTVHMYEY